MTQPDLDPKIVEAIMKRRLMIDLGMIPDPAANHPVARKGESALEQQRSEAR